MIYLKFSITSTLTYKASQFLENYLQQIIVSISGIDLKKASKFFGSRFACGSSVTGDDEIVIQGDCKDDLWDVIPEKWTEVNELCSFTR